MKFFIHAIILLSSSFFLTGCLEKSKLSISTKNPKKIVTKVNSINITSVQVVNHQIKITGSGLDGVTSLKIKNTNFDETFNIESASATQIIANAKRSITFGVGQIFDLIMGSAQGAATFPVSFSLENGSITAGMLSSMGASSGQILKYNGTAWIPTSVTASQLYRGTWNVSTNTPDLDAITSDPGDYYIVTTGGTHNAITYSVGDYAISDGTNWSRLENNYSFNGRSGAVMPQAGDYNWSQITKTGSKLEDIADINIAGRAAGKVLKWSGTDWIMADDDNSIGGGTPAAGSITDLEVSATANIAQSKISNLTTSLAGKEPVITAAATTTYFRGDKTFVTLNTAVVPESGVTNLYFSNARVLLAPLTGVDTNLAGTISASDTILQAFGKTQKQIDSIGTASPNFLIKNSTDSITGVVNVNTIGLLKLGYTPTNLDDAANKQYVDTKLSGSGTVNYIPYYSATTTLANSPVAVSGSNVGIGTTTPGSSLDVKGTLRLSGSTSGYVGFAPPAVAGSTIYTLPAADGSSGQVLRTDGAGVLSWVTDSAGSGGFTDLTGDVTATGTGSVATTVALVGGVTAANVATGANLANAATNLNTASTIIKRDASGNFSAGTITATLNGTATNVTGTVAVANGGTGATTLGLNQLLFGNGTGAIGTLATTATPSVLLSAVTTGAPTWTTSTAGNVLKGSATGVEFGPLDASDLPAGTLSGSGTTNYIPYYSAASILADSPVAVSGANVGIGTVAPGQKLSVAGTIESTSGGIKFPDGTTQTTAATGSTPGGLNTELQFNNNGVFGSSYLLTWDGSRLTSNEIGLYPDVGSITAVLKFDGNDFKITTYENNFIIPLLDVDPVKMPQGRLQIGNDTYEETAALQIDSTTRGLLLPRMSSIEKNAIPAAPNGLIVFDNTQNKLNIRSQNDWTSVVAENSSGDVGIGTETPGSKLDVKGTLRLSGSTSGYVGLAPAAVAGSTTYTLPSADGSSGQVLRTNGSGVLSWVNDNAGAGAFTGTADKAVVTNGSGALATITTSSTELGYVAGVTSAIQTQLDAKQASGNYVTALTGDVTATGPGAVAATVAAVGGVTAANVATGANLANAATESNTASTIVKRDASGNFSAGTITATLNGTATNVSGTVAVANGGTGATTLGLNQLLFGNGTAAVGTLATTATPSVLLSAVTTGAPTWTTSTAGNVLKGSVTGVEFGALLLSDLPAGTLSGSGTANYIPYYSAASTLANSPVAILGNNVGIGTNAPSTNFHILAADPNYRLESNSATGFSTNEIINDNGDALEMYLFGSGTPGTEAGIPKANLGVINYGGDNLLLISTGSGTSPIVLAPSRSEAMRILPSGNVGIGTTSPGSTLDVKGTLRLSGSTSGYVGFTPAAAAGSTTYTLPAADGTSGQVLSTSGAGVLSWATVSGGGAPTGAAGGDLDGTYPNPTIGSNKITDTHIADAAISQTKINGLTTALSGKEPTITAGTSAQYLKGDKTLGTFLTDVMNSLLTSISFATNSAITAADSLLVALGKLQAQVTSLGSTKLDKTGGTLSVGTISGVPTPTNADDVANKGYVDSFGQWTKVGSDINRASGNVGIGMSPGAFYKLDVAGTMQGQGLQIKDPSNANSSNAMTNTIYGVDSAESIAWAIGDSDSSGKNLRLYGAGGYGVTLFSNAAERMRIDTDGNVGVGTATPASKLQVSGAITNTVSTFSGAFTCGTSGIDFSAGNFQRLSPSNTPAAGTCGVVLSNMVAGGSYTLIVTGNAATNAVVYAFSGYTFKYLPANAATTAGKDSIYTFLYDGTTVYVTWTGGY